MHFSTSIASKAISLLAVAGGVNGFWRMPCKGRTGLARIDPLVDFGIAGAHVHAIHGSDGFSATSGTDDLRAGDCTSCQVTQDKSAYWHPALYFKKASGEFQVVKQIGGMLAYYLLEPLEEKLTAYPKGFEMLAGDSYQRNFTYPVPDIEKSLWSGQYNEQPFLRQWALGFNCLNYQAAPEGSLNRHFMPDKAFLDEKCTDGIRLEIMFPSCWDGKNLDGINHDKRSHVAYPALGNTGACPAGFPVRLSTLFYESIWNTYEFKGQDGQFVFSNGDPTGYGYHADFIMGWDEAFLQSAIDTCKNLSGRIEDCPIFTLQTEDNMNQCTLKAPESAIMSTVFSEKVDNVNALPGNVPIKAGPAYAEGDAAAPVQPGAPIPSAIVPSLEVKPATAVDPNLGYLPGAVLKESVKPSATPTPSSPAAGDFKVKAVGPATHSPATTPPASLPPPSAGSPSFVSTQYITKGREVVEVLWVEELVTVTASVTTTTTTVVGGGERKRHLYRHRRREDWKMG